MPVPPRHAPARVPPWLWWALKVVALLAFIIGLIVATTFGLLVLWYLVQLEADPGRFREGSALSQPTPLLNALERPLEDLGTLENVWH